MRLKLKLLSMEWSLLFHTKTSYWPIDMTCPTLSLSLVTLRLHFLFILQLLKVISKQPLTFMWSFFFNGWLNYHLYTSWNAITDKSKTYVFEYHLFIQMSKEWSKFLYHIQSTLNNNKYINPFITKYIY